MKPAFVKKWHLFRSLASLPFSVFFFRESATFYQTDKAFWCNSVPQRGRRNTRCRLSNGTENGHKQQPDMPLHSHADRLHSSNGKIVNTSVHTMQGFLYSYELFFNPQNQVNCRDNEESSLKNGKTLTAIWLSNFWKILVFLHFQQMFTLTQHLASRLNGGIIMDRVSEVTLYLNRMDHTFSV